MGEWLGGYASEQVGERVGVPVKNHVGMQVGKWVNTHSTNSTNE